MHLRTILGDGTTAKVVLKTHQHVTSQDSGSSVYSSHNWTMYTGHYLSTDYANHFLAVTKHKNMPCSKVTFFQSCQYATAILYKVPGTLLPDSTSSCVARPVCPPEYPISGRLKLHKLPGTNSRLRAASNEVSNLGPLHRSRPGANLVHINGKSLFL